VTNKLYLMHYYSTWDKQCCSDISDECTVFIFRLTGADSAGCWSNWEKEMIQLCGKISRVFEKGRS